MAMVNSALRVEVNCAALRGDSAMSAGLFRSAGATPCWGATGLLEKILA